MATILHIFADYACPWCYLGRSRMKRALRTSPAMVATIHFPLNASMPAEGRLMRPYLEAKGLDVEVAGAKLRVMMRQERLPYQRDPDTARMWPTRRAHELAAWAVEQPDGLAIHDALFRAYHAENANLGSVDVLVDVSASIGLDADAARQLLETRAAAKLVDAHYALATRIGISVLPTFVIDRRRLVGAQSSEEISAFVSEPEAPPLVPTPALRFAR